MVGQAVKDVATDTATSVVEGGDVPTQEGVQQQVVTELLNPANMFAMGQITGKILANMFKATLP